MERELKHGQKELNTLDNGKKEGKLDMDKDLLCIQMVQNLLENLWMDYQMEKES